MPRALLLTFLFLSACVTPVAVAGDGDAVIVDDGPPDDVIATLTPVYYDGVPPIGGAAIGTFAAAAAGATTAASRLIWAAIAASTYPTGSTTAGREPPSAAVAADSAAGVPHAWHLRSTRPSAPHPIDNLARLSSWLGHRACHFAWEYLGAIADDLPILRDLKVC